MFADHLGQKVALVAKTVIRNQNDAMLVLLRSKDAPHRPLTWDLPGGSLEANEEPARAALREAQEETGIKLASVELLDVSFVVKRKGLKGPVITFIYTNTQALHAHKIELSFEHTEYRWTDKKGFLALEIPEKYKDAVRRLD